MHFQRAGCLRDETAPQELLLDKLEEIEKDPELKEKTAKRDAKRLELQVSFGSLRSSPELERKQYEDLNTQERCLRKRLQEVALGKSRNSWQVE
jgi:hypothetical protein